MWFFAKSKVFAIATVMTVALQDQGAGIVKALWEDYDLTERSVLFSVSEPRHASISLSVIEALITQRPSYHWMDGLVLNDENSAALIGRLSWSLGDAV